MHRAILEACLPCLIALAVALAALVAVVRVSGCRLRWRRLREVHSCQDGGVQSLAFVLTLPLFIVIVQFIVQVSQLMIGTMVVNYGAFATARSASVWIPALVLENPGVGIDPEDENDVWTVPVVLAFDQARVPDADVPVWEYVAYSSTPRSAKFGHIYTAAVMACAPLAPSRDLGIDNALQNAAVSETVLGFYRSMAPSADNPRLPARIDNKLAYSFRHTSVRLERSWPDGIDKDRAVGPTYNPPEVIVGANGQILHVPREYELGWQEPTGSPLQSVRGVGYRYRPFSGFVLGFGWYRGARKERASR
jgi:hypothetical protein